jgi:hypothetical protein
MIIFGRTKTKNYAEMLAKQEIKKMFSALGEVLYAVVELAVLIKVGHKL